MHCVHFCCLPNIHAPILKRSEALFSASFTSGSFSWFHRVFRNTEGTCFNHQDIAIADPFHWRMNVSCDCQDPPSPVTKKRIKTRTWYVEFTLEVTSEVSDVIDDPDFDITQRVKKILDAADQERNIRTLANASFSYDAEHRWYGNIVNISGFIHARDQIRKCTVESYIQDSHVLDQHWKPVSVEPGKRCNWWEHETIRGLVSACASGHRVLVDCKWTGDTSAPINKGGRPKKSSNVEETAAGADAAGARMEAEEVPRRRRGRPRNPSNETVCETDTELQAAARAIFRRLPMKTLRQVLADVGFEAGV